MRTRTGLMMGLVLSLASAGMARAPQNQEPEITLTRSGPITVTSDGQVIQNKLIQARAQDGIVISSKKNVTIRRCRILYSTGHQGIRFSQAHGLRIEDCEIVCANAPKTGKIEGHNSNCISGYESDGVSIERVKMSDGSAGIYLLICDRSTIRTVEGHNFRGDFPRGQFIQFDKCIGGLIEHFSVINDPSIAYTEDNINCYKSGAQVIRNGLIQGNNSPSGVGILWEDQNDPKARGGFGGLVEDVDLVDMGNGACTGADGARDIVFRRVRVRDNRGLGQAGRAKPGSNSLVFSGYGEPGNRGKHLRLEQCVVFNLAKPNNLTWPRDSFEVVDVTTREFEPRAPIVLTWNWSQ